MPYASSSSTRSVTKPGQRVLPDDADHVGEVARPVGARVSRPATVTRPASSAAGEVRDVAVDGAEQGRLAGAGRSDDQAELALGHVQVDAAQDGPGRVGVGDGDALEADHAATSLGRACGAVGSATGSRLAASWRRGRPGGHEADEDGERRQQRQGRPGERAGRHRACPGLAEVRARTRTSGRYGPGEHRHPLGTAPGVGAVARADCCVGRPSRKPTAASRQPADDQERETERARGCRRRAGRRGRRPCPSARPRTQPGRDAARPDGDTSARRP